MVRAFSIPVVLGLLFALGVIALSRGAVGARPGSARPLEPVRNDAPAPMEGPSARPGRASTPDAPFSCGGSGTLRIVARAAADGSPAALIRVDVVSFNDASGRRRRLSALTDESGEAILANVPAGPSKVFVGDDCRYWSLEPGGQDVVEIELPRRREATGVVVDAREVPVPGALVWVSCAGSGELGDVAGVTGADGRFRIRHVASGRRVAVRAAGFAWSDRRDVPDEGDGPMAELRFVLAGPSCRISGRVVDDEGRAIGGAWIGCARTEAGPPAVEVAADAAGRFEAEGLTTGEWTVEAWSEGHAPACVRTNVIRGVDAPVVMTLRRGVAVEGIVRDEHGRPLPRVVVSARPRDAVGGPVSTASAADGSFRLDHLGGAGVLAKAGYLAGAHVRAALDLRPGGSVVWNPVIASKAVLRGTVTDAHGTGRAFAHVRASSRSGHGSWVAETIADRTGCFEIPDCPGSGLVVEIDVARWGDGGTWTVRDVIPGSEALVIAIPESARPTSFIEGRISSADDAPLEGLEVAAFRVESPSGASRTALSRAPDGSFRIGPLAPGSYLVEAQATSGARMRLAECVVPAVGEIDLGECRLEREGFLKVLLSRRDGAPVSQRLVVMDRWSRGVATLRPVAGFATSGPMGPGDYVLHVEGAGVAPAVLAFQIVPGETTALAVEIAAAK